jgi:hypothetical protein
MDLLPTSNACKAIADKDRFDGPAEAAEQCREKYFRVLPADMVAETYKRFSSGKRRRAFCKRRTKNHAQYRKCSGHIKWMVRERRKKLFGQLKHLRWCSRHRSHKKCRGKDLAKEEAKIQSQIVLKASEKKILREVHIRKRRRRRRFRW